MSEDLDDTEYVRRTIIKLAKERRGLYKNRHTSNDAYQNRLRKDMLFGKNPRFKLLIQLQINSEGPKGPLKFLHSNLEKIIDSDSSEDLELMQRLDEAISRVQEKELDKTFLRNKELVDKLVSLHMNAVVMPLQFLHSNAGKESFRNSFYLRGSFTHTSSENVASNIQTFLNTVLPQPGQISYNNMTYRIATCSWDKLRLAPFGYRIEKYSDLPTTSKLLDLPPNFDTIIIAYANAVEIDVRPPTISETENQIESVFYKDTYEFDEYKYKEKNKAMTGGGCMPTEMLQNLLTFVEDGAPVLHDLFYGSVGVLLEMSREARAIFTKVNPFEEFSNALNWYKGDICYNNHTNFKVLKLDAAGKCRDFIYDYLAYRFSIYHLFFNAQKAHAFADVPFFSWSKKNSDLTKKLIANEFDPKLSKPLRELHTAWTEYDRQFIEKAVKLQHLDTMALLWICKSHLICLLNEAANAINSTILKYLLTKPAKCEKDTAFTCLHTLNNLVQEDASYQIPNYTTVKIPELTHSRSNDVKITESKLLSYMRKNEIKFNGETISQDTIAPQCEKRAETEPDAENEEEPLSSLTKAVKQLAQAEHDVDVMKAKSENKVFVSLTHTTPCDEFLVTVVEKKIRLYEIRRTELYETRVQCENIKVELKKKVREQIASTAKKVLEGVQMSSITDDSYFNKIVGRSVIVDEMCSIVSPKFDVSYDELNELHAVYAKHLKKLSGLIKKLGSEVIQLKKFDPEGLNKIQAIQSAHTKLSTMCSTEFGLTDIPSVFKETNTDASIDYLEIARKYAMDKKLTPLIKYDDLYPSITTQILQKFMNFKPAVMLKQTNIQPTNTRPIYNLMQGKPINFSTFNLHAPILIDSAEMWLIIKQGLHDKQEPPPEFLTFVYVANATFNDAQQLILQNKYSDAIIALRLVLYFHIYQFDYERLLKDKDLDVKRKHLEAFYSDSKGIPALNKILEESVLVYKDNFADDTSESLNKYIFAFRTFTNKRREIVYLQLYNLLHTIGDHSNAHRYESLFSKPVSKWPYQTAYKHAVATKLAGKSISKTSPFSYSSSYDWTLSAIKVKLKEFLEKKPDIESTELQAALEVDIQYDLGILETIPRKNINFNWVSCIQRLSPDHVLSRVVQRVHDTLYPLDTDLTKSEQMVAAYMTNKDASVAFEEEVGPKLKDMVQDEIDKFKNADTSKEVEELLSNIPYMKESGWPPESKSIFSQGYSVITNAISSAPYLDGEYSVLAIATVNAISEGHQLLKDENLYKTSGIPCSEKLPSLSRLKNLLSSKGVAPIPTDKATSRGPVYNQGYSGYNQGYSGYNQGYSGYNQGYSGYNPGYSGYNQGYSKK